MAQRQNRITLIGPDGPVVSRRAFLRGSLIGATALGAGALSTPTAAQYGGGPGAMPGGAAKPGPAPGGIRRGKVSKAAARYQYRPHRGRRCGRCAHFFAPDGCEVVAGSISPQGWCRYFKPAA